jgi:hypothetical protein
MFSFIEHIVIVRRTICTKLELHAERQKVGKVENHQESKVYKHLKFPKVISAELLKE